MTNLPEKKRILDENGFRYNLLREIYFNRSLKKVFSLEYIEDNTLELLNNNITTENPNDTWIFYFNNKPSQGIIDELIKELNK